MRFLALFLIVFAGVGAFAQSGRIAQRTRLLRLKRPHRVLRPSPPSSRCLTRRMVISRQRPPSLTRRKCRLANGFLRRQSSNSGSWPQNMPRRPRPAKTLAGEDFYYLGMLHWIAENLDGTAENLRKFIVIPDADAGRRRQTARSIVVVVLAKQKKLDEAETLLAEYLKNRADKTDRTLADGGRAGQGVSGPKGFCPDGSARR